MIAVPLLCLILLHGAVQLFDTAIIFAHHVLSNEKLEAGKSFADVMTESSNQPMNQSYISFFVYAGMIVLFGIWYVRVFLKDAELPRLIRENGRRLGLFRALLLLAAGAFGQFFVDAALALARPIFPEAFARYDEMIAKTVGVYSSWLSVLTVILLAPVAEELLFRGVCFGYARRVFSPVWAVLLIALIFGVYHGNLIQFLYAFLLGTLLAFLRERADSLLPCMLLHFSLNLCALFANWVGKLPTGLLVLSFFGFGALFGVAIFFVFRKKNSEVK